MHGIVGGYLQGGLCIILLVIIDVIVDTLQRYLLLFTI